MFRTELHIPPSKEKLTWQHSVFTLGSCFADALGNRLNDFKFQTLINPFGTVYNPVSLHTLMQLAVAKQSLPSNSFLQQEEIHYNYNLHSTFSSLQKNQLSHSLEILFESAHHFLAKANALMITYGTAWVYERKDTGEIVANCHKQPSALFNKRLLTHQEIVESFRETHTILQTFNPNLRILLTVSPVRHVKETLELNSVSKAILRSACHELSTAFSNVGYFPAYEILLDDLRDYRFYKSDMLHPSKEAEDYIWEKFSACYFDDATRTFIQQWKEIQMALAHKAFHSHSKGHQQFLKSLVLRISELKSVVNVEEELSIIQSQIISA